MFILGFMSNSREVLAAIVGRNSPSQRQFAINLKWQRSHLSKVLVGEMEVTRAVVSRCLLILERDDAIALIEAYLDDEVESLRADRDDFAEELKMKPKADIKWQARIKIS